MNRLLMLALAPAAIAAPAMAQDHSGHDMSSMPGMSSSAAKPAKPAKPAQAAKPAAAAPAQGHSGHDMSSMPGMSPSATAQPAKPDQAAQPAAAAPAQDHSGHDMSGMPGMAPAVDPHAGHATAADAGAMSEEQGPLPVSDDPVAIPEPPKDFAADKVFGTAAMARSRQVLALEHGGARVSQLRANILEWAPQSGKDGYRWDVEGWYGGDINRVVVKTEADGLFGGKLEKGEVQLLYSRAVARYTDVQVGVRQDIGERASRTYLTAAFDTMLPYWFEIEGAAFLSDKGDAFARLEGSYDLRLTQRLVLQPRAELEFAAQDVPRQGVAAGLTDGEFGLRLRYEIRREFAPYIGVSHERQFGGTADLAKALGRSTRDTTFVVGLRAWF